MGIPSRPVAAGAAADHASIDMQRLPADGTPRHVPSLNDIFPTIEEIA